MNEETPPTEEQIGGTLVDVQQNELHSLNRQPQDPRRRLRELLAIPDRDRTDALWDEIIGLEIQLAPGNCAQSSQAGAGRNQEPKRRPEPSPRPNQMWRQEPSSRTGPGVRFSKKRKRGPRTPT